MKTLSYEPDCLYTGYTAGNIRLKSFDLKREHLEPEATVYETIRQSTSPFRWDIAVSCDGRESLC